MAQLERAFERIYAMYFDDVFLFLRQLTKDESLAEEMTSETFFKAIRSIDQFRGDCDIRVWLCQIAKNGYISYLKKHRRTVNLEDIENIHLPEYADSIEKQILRQTDVMQIHRILHGLSEPYKEVFMLRVFGELSFKQIASIFQKTENWACVAYHRAKNKIAEQMEDDDEK